ncbi:unnamed protein product [Litomosoides sigmodontis]|uniref:Thioredoxin domain-containing protein n=1 Tax=Litomosoides sigmodontis TaxID=42156 RepID=A0A3P6U560_LITSI|nr:unnamed protein product [Litomosoides sigmodontis]
MWLSMLYTAAEYISAPGSAECISDLVRNESTAEGKQCLANVGSDKWARKFCQKFIDSLNMRSLIASLVLSILVLNFDALRNSNGQLSQRESALPRPFFPPTSKKYLVDYYTGNDAEPENLLYNSEIVIVMYYAPWSRRCTRTRVIFENVARSLSFSSDISFAAVNCFFPRGQCRKSYKTYTYPVIVAYIGKQSLMYTGSLASDYIYRWISRLRNPIRRLTTPFAIKNFFDEFDDAVIAFFHIETAFAASHEFEQYVKAALIVFQHQDLLDKVGFAVVTNSTLAMTVNSSPKTWIQLKTWNCTYNYNESNITAYQIFEWIKNQADKSNGLQWISPEMNGVAKSEELLSVLQHGATVVVFVDRQILYPHSWIVSVVKQTIMEYYACGTDLTNQMKSRIHLNSVPSIGLPGVFIVIFLVHLHLTATHLIQHQSLVFHVTKIIRYGWFIGVDSRYGDYILKRLKRPSSGRAVALIVDPSTERTFFMQAEFSRHNFRSFLRAFHSASLVPHVISQAIRKRSEEGAYDNLSVLLSTNAKSFKADVNSSEDIVVFFSGGNWHGPSASVFHIYHSVAHYFYPFLKLIKFYIIDVSLNDLPWQFQMDALPSVLFFPAGRMSSSSRFPALVPLTVPNLIAFIVTRCRRELRWQLAFSSCSSLCIKRNSLRLQKIAVRIRNDITLLRLLASSNYEHSRLFQHLIQRRSEQLYSTRRLLKIVSMSKSS